jgi:hypothetical protein
VSKGNFHARQAAAIEISVSQVAAFLMTKMAEIGLKKYRSKINQRGQKTLALGGRILMYLFAQFRTCLWSCVGWWGSGQEAG